MPRMVHSLMDPEVLSWDPGVSVGQWEPWGGVGRPPLKYSLAANTLSHLGHLVPSLGLSFQVRVRGLGVPQGPSHSGCPGRSLGLSKSSSCWRQEAKREEPGKQQTGRPGWAPVPCPPWRQATGVLPLPYLAPAGSR